MVLVHLAGISHSCVTLIDKASAEHLWTDFFVGVSLLVHALGRVIKPGSKAWVC